MKNQFISAIREQYEARSNTCMKSRAASEKEVADQIARPSTAKARANNKDHHESFFKTVI